MCSIDHTYQSFYTSDDVGETTWIDLSYMQELFTENPQTDLQQSYVYYEKWMKIRTDDINFIIDTVISEIEDSNESKVYKSVDIERIGVMGHSLGGSAALGIGRMRNDIRAVIALESPFMNDIEGIKDSQFVFTDKIYPVPLLNVYSDSSWSILGDRPQYAANYALLTTDVTSVFNVHISGVGHLALTDFALSSPLLTRILDRQDTTEERTIYALKTINKVCLEFFNSYLKETGDFVSDGSY